MLESWSIGRKDPNNDDGSRTIHGAKGSLPAGESVEFDKALESLAWILRSLGRHAFGLDELSEEAIEKKFEQWAMHVLVGA
jgi:hypothetical protein